MTTKKLHRVLGWIFGPIFVFAGITALPLFWRKDGVYSDSVKELLVSLHTWEIGAKYIGIVLAVALIVVSSTGLVLTFRATDKDQA
jgi:hypothetical protein